MDAHDELRRREPARRLAAMAALAPDRRRRVDHLLSRCPLPAWPFGMPTSIAPLVVVVGVSPGDSPNASVPDIAPDRPYPEPTFGTPNPGLFYPDGSHYWEKIRELLLMAVSRFDYDLADDPDRALALAGNLNLGVHLAGRGTLDATDVEITRWVSWVLTQMKPRTVIGLGLVGLLVNPPSQQRAKAEALREAWDRGGTLTGWSPGAWTTERANVNGHEYAFRFQTTLIDDETTSILLWPNHPSRAPFAGRGGEGSRWAESVEAARLVLARLRSYDSVDA